MNITYTIKNSLYVNLTNHCTNRCEFCIRDVAPGEPFPDLRLERDPTVDEVMADLSSYNSLNKFSEIVFCGYGEPTCRLYDMLEICKKLREMTATPIRVNTNGHASLILGEDTPPLFKGLVDCVSVSLNAADPITYNRICRPRFGEDAFPAVVRFAREVARYVPTVILTVVRGTISDEDVERCAKIAEDIGAKFRVREYIEK
ncbi:MAG: radical SAM protein [Clostridia bacterium]|jgi:TatD family-associated radical SAM protein|nr:radical SAM protein [Clostridia bacterium]MBQ4350663.1 radical SAM protein [Clostridia bacterium]